MDPIYAVRTTYDETMFYHQYVAAKPRMAPKQEKKKLPLPEIGLSDIGMGVLLFFVFFMTFSEVDLVTRLVATIVAVFIATAVLRRLNGKKGETKGTEVTQNMEAENDKKQARALLENSGLSGKRCTMMFGEDSFTVENPGILTEYRYEGVAWIKETPKYYVIFWNRSLSIPVEKAGFYRGKKDQFGAFLEKKCQKIIEKVKVAA